MIFCRILVIGTPPPPPIYVWPPGLLAFLKILQLFSKVNWGQSLTVLSHELKWWNNCQMVSQKHKYCKNFERNSDWRWHHQLAHGVIALLYQLVQEPEFSWFSLLIFSFISQLIWVRLGWIFQPMILIQVFTVLFNWSFTLWSYESQHSYPVPVKDDSQVKGKSQVLQ